MAIRTLLSDLFDSFYVFFSLDGGLCDALDDLNEAMDNCQKALDEEVDSFKRLNKALDELNKKLDKRNAPASSDIQETTE